MLRGGPDAAPRAPRCAATTMPVMRTRRAWSLSGDGPIDIRRDAGGVPHVRAATEADVLRGLGHCHGVDRGLQLVLTRIIGQGRAAEILEGGEDMVAMDMFFRRIGMASGAEAHVELVSERHRALLEAYVDGINRALDAKRPWELRLVRHRPEPWTAADCMLMARMIGFVGLAQSQGEVERWLVQMLTAGVPVAVLDQLFGRRVAGFDETLLAGLRVEEPLVPTTVRWHRAVPAAAGSNNWAVAPSRTATGSAMLANDPHLEINRLPGIWYEAVLAGSDGWSAGASIPGLPAIIAGRNPAVAWGPTYACADVIDSWIEDCRDGCFRREVDGEERWEPFEAREQVIHRRGRAPLRVCFHTNLHGTLDGDPQVAGRYLATCWAGRDAGAKSIAATLELPHARSASEAGELLSRIEWAFNWVIADRGGSLVYRMSGRIPRRRKGASGLLPLAGWRPDDDWQGFHDPGELPQRIDPPEGYIATANEDLNRFGIAHPINMPGPPYRAARIAEVLSSRSDWSVEELGRLQMDAVSLQAQRFMSVLRPLLADDERFVGILQWDGSYEDSRYASWFEAFYRAGAAEVLTWACGPEAARYVLAETDLIPFFFWLIDDVLLDPTGGWAGEHGRDAALRRLAIAALATAVNRAASPTMTMRHIMLGGRLPRWIGFDHGPVPLRGGRATIHQTQQLRAGGRDITAGPSFRLVTDLARDDVWTAYPGGPSDRRFSPWFSSGVRDWLAGRLKPVRPNPHDDR